MKIFAKSLLAGSALVLAGTAQAANINVTVYDDADAGYTIFQDFLGTTLATENFDGLGYDPSYSGNQYQRYEAKSTSFSTAVGTFEMTQPGRGGLNVFNDELKIESERTGQFGREVLSNYEGDFWLDSADAEVVTWNFSGGDLNKSFNTFGFFLADAADVSANLTLTFSDGTTAATGFSVIPFGENNQNVKFVRVTSDKTMLNGTMTFSNSTDNDGWGIDDVTVGTLPEPGTLLLMGLGLLGLGAARRRTAK